MYRIWVRNQGLWCKHKYHTTDVKNFVQTFKLLSVLSFEKLCLNAMFSVYFQLLLQSLLFLLLSFLVLCPLSGQPLFSPHKQINLQIKLRGWGLSLFIRASAGFDHYVLV